MTRRLTTNRQLLAVLLFGLLLLRPNDAAAEGTHLLVEGHAGVALPLGAETESAGLSAGATAGFGGRLGGTPLRLYAIVEFNYSSFVISREDSDGVLRALERNLIDVEAGGRAMIPLGTPYVRLFADVLIGMSWLERELPVATGRTALTHDDAPRFGIYSAIGVQVRPIELFSIGLKADFGFLLDDSDLVYTNDGFDEISGRLNLVGTATVHF